MPEPLIHSNTNTNTEPLAAWTYTNPELCELEYQAVFRRRWQLLGHVNDVPEAGHYLTVDMGRDNLILLRGNDEKLRAFLNVCRHRGSRLLEGSGVCERAVQCPYHGWTYRFDGSLAAVPQGKNFANLDLAEYGLHQVQVDIFNGLVFARIEGDGPNVAEHFAQTANYFELHDVANYESIAPTSSEVWNANWKVIWDNYLENYHIPIAHPGLQRLIKENGEFVELDGGVSLGVFVLRDKPSPVAEERRYQEQLVHANKRVPEHAKGKWPQYGYSPNLGIDLYPEMLDLFQLIPLAVDKTLVRTSFYGHQNPTLEEQELRRLNMSINSKVNNEDRDICTRMQQGLSIPGYQPGPLSSAESSVLEFHRLLRSLVPVMARSRAPAPGTVALENSRLTI